VNTAEPTALWFSWDVTHGVSPLHALSRLWVRSTEKLKLVCIKVRPI